MFRLNRHRSDRSSGERVECKLSCFQAFQVPRGWDKLYVSIVSVETGKTIAKSSKAAVHGGTCQWTESFSEWIWVYQDDASKELEESLYKINVAMGSARSGILGELVLNLTDYISPRDAAPLSLPLKKCNYGTILQIKIQCYPKTRSRDRNSWKETAYHHEDMHSIDEEKDNRSDGSDNILAKSLASSSGSHLGITTYADQLGNREAILSATGSHRSSDSGEGSVGRTGFSPMKSLNGGVYMGRQESGGSRVSATSGVSPGDDVSRSNQSSFNSRASDTSNQTNHWQDTTSQTSPHGSAPLSLRPSDSSKDLLEAAEETIEELRDEAKMWERHSQKVKLDLETLKKQYSEKCKQHVNLELELSTACTERDSSKQEVVKLQSSIKELMTKQNVASPVKINEMIRVQNALEDELKFQKETNANLNLQMKRTQEANIELVSILQELEETVERQNLEIANISQNSHIDDQEDDSRSQPILDIETEWESKLTSKEEEIMMLEEKLAIILNAQRRGELACIEGDPEMTKEIEVLKAKVQELERDCTELTEENLELIFKMKATKNTSQEGKPSQHSTYPDSRNSSPDNSALNIGLLKPEINQLEQDHRKKEMLHEDLTVRLNTQIKVLEEKCTDLEFELQHFKEHARHLDIELQRSQALAKENLREFTETSRILSEMKEQVHIAITHVKILCYDSDSDANTDFEEDNDHVKSSNQDTDTQKRAQGMLNDFLELNKLLGESIVERKSLSRDMGAANYQENLFATKDQEYLPSNRVRENASDLHVESHFGNDVDEKKAGRKCELKDLRSCILLRDKEIDVLENSNRELEDMISSIQREKGQLEGSLELLEHSNKDLEDAMSSIQREKGQLEEKLAVALRESSINSKCLDEVRHDLIKITREMESQVSTNKMLEIRSLELENSKNDLEMHLSELEVENTKLSEHVSGLEAELKDLTHEKESNRLELELEHSKSRIVDLTRDTESQLSTIKMLERRSLELESTATELEIHLSELEVENTQLTEHASGLEAELRHLTSEKEANKLELENSKSQILDLVRDMESQVSTIKMLERKSLEHESSKSDVEIHLAELEIEHTELSEHTSSLEAQLRSLTRENDSIRVELEDSKFLILDLKNEQTNRQTDLETQMSELRQKLQEAHIQLSEVLEATENLKRSNSKLQGTVQSRTEEINSLQQLNGDLRKQKLELHERYSQLEVQLNESEKKVIDFCQKVECLELEISSLQKDIDTKEKFLISQIDNIYQEHLKHEENITQAHLILNQMESAKAFELEHLKREIAHLTLQVSSSHDEQESMKSDAVREVFNLRLDKTKLETSLQEAHAKVKLYETELHSVRQESVIKVRGLVDSLNASKQTEEMLMGDIQRMQSLMVSVKTSEEKFRATTNELEVKLKTSDYEKQQVLEEMLSLKVQLDKIAHLQEEVSTLEHSLDEAKSEKGKLERSLHSVSEECEELKKQIVSFMEKVSNLQNALHDGEDDRRSKIALEEKLLRLERDLTGREASHTQEAELKNELNRTKRANSEFQRKIQSLEEEKYDFMRKAQELEKELMLKNESNHDEAVSSENGIKMHTEPLDIEQSTDLVKDMQHVVADQHERPAFMESLQIGKEDDLKSKIHTLENELAQALETSTMYKVQLTSILSEQQNGEPDLPKETISKSDTKTDNLGRIATLEMELKEMQERYLHMSLQYAEVEASREELVMQLKSSQKGKKWFS